jgi:hypothetical protein
MADDAFCPVEVAWSPGRVEQLRLHHAMGLSAAVSAELIGGVSRNAVISKRRRLGLVGANPLQSALRRMRTARRGAETKSSLRWQGPSNLRCEPLPDMDWPPPPDAQPRFLADKRSGQCAWPLGPAEAPADFRTRFCCAPTERRRSYCAAHQARAVVPPRPKDAS